MKLYTIGFTKKTAQEFFEILIKNHVERIIDIRLNNDSQLAGFSKSKDLSYFLKKLANISYEHRPEFAPTKKILNGYKNKEISWEDYEKEYISLLEQRNILRNVDYSLFNNACLLCSEATEEKCHRRLFAEYLAKHNRNITIIHLR